MIQIAVASEFKNAIMFIGFIRKASKIIYWNSIIAATTISGWCLI